MRILQVITTNRKEAGGTVEGIAQIQSGLRAIGHHVSVLSTLSNGSQSFFDERHLSHIALADASLGYGYSKRLDRWLKDNLKGYDAVFIEGLWQYHSQATARECTRQSIPYFVFTHGMLDPWFLGPGLLRKIRKKLYWKAAERNTLECATGVFFTCKEEQTRSWQSFNYKAPHEYVVGYGIAQPPAHQELYDKLYLKLAPAAKEKHTILFMSRIHEKKGCNLLLEAYEKVLAKRKDIHLIIAGDNDNEYARHLCSLADKLGVSEHITWTGFVSGESKWALLHSCDVVALPSHQENFGVIVAEALACSKPVLISNKVNIWKEVVAESSGIVSDDTLPGTINTLSKWFGLSNDDRALMGQNAIRCYENHFKVSAAVRHIDQILSRTLIVDRDESN